jgi:hypothetical protein
MTGMSRRRFLTETALTAAGSTLIGSVASGLVRPAKAVAAAAAGADPNFIAGQVVGQTGPDAFTVRDIDSEIRTIYLTGASSVWKEGQWDETSLSEGDCLYATGESEADGTLNIERLWANINSFAAEVVGAGRGQVMVRTPAGKVRPTGVIGLTEVLTPRGVAKGNASALQPGTFVQVIEFRDPATGNQTASRLISLTADTADLPPVDAGATSDGTKVGLATWFCCGDVSGCGAECGSSGGGACVNCKSNEKQLAWPELTTGCARISRSRWPR